MTNQTSTGAMFAKYALPAYIYNKATVSDGENGWETLRLPFLDRFNNNIELSIKREGNIVAISDDFQYIDDYENNALETSIKIAERHGLKVLKDEDNNFELCCTFDNNKDDYGKNLINFITAILKMQGLSYKEKRLDRKRLRDGG